MDDIDALVDATDTRITQIFDKKECTIDDNRRCQNILVDITQAKNGIQNLKITYKNDTFIQSRLDIIHDKFDVCKNKLSEKLLLFTKI